MPSRPLEPVASPRAPTGPLLVLRNTDPPPPLKPARETPTPSEAPPPPAARGAEPPIVQRRELPPDIQRELPTLSVSGTVYSSDRAQRIVIVNGELLHEGDSVGPGLVLEEIRRKDAVLRFRGQRFSVSP